MTSKQDELLQKIGEFSERRGVAVYAVGGYIRDKLLSRETKEIDFMVLGDGPAFAASAVKELGGRGLVTFDRFGTAFFETGDYKMEFVTARREMYDKNSRNPEVEKSDFETDIKRRDFTINAMAAQVTSRGLGDIVDILGGRKDLEKKIIRTPL
ncbi:tRNA nucleotidyltransferase, partial [bacterium]|nr:tRNA nucleotidyltransferase [bacterium]